MEEEWHEEEERADAAKHAEEDEVRTAGAASRAKLVPQFNQENQ